MIRLASMRRYNLSRPIGRGQRRIPLIPESRHDPAHSFRNWKSWKLGNPYILIVRASCISYGVRISRADRHNAPRRTPRPRRRVLSTTLGVYSIKHGSAILGDGARDSFRRSCSMSTAVGSGHRNQEAPKVTGADRGPCLRSQSTHERGRICPSVGPRAVTLRVPRDPRPNKKETETERDAVERL